MQLSLNFGVAPDTSLDLTQFRRRLVSGFGSFGAGGVRLSPMDQLVKSLISSRTHDEDSQATYDRLKFRYPDWNDLADAPIEEVRDLLCPITYGDEKADWLCATLKLIRRRLAEDARRGRAEGGGGGFEFLPSADADHGGGHPRSPRRQALRFCPGKKHARGSRPHPDEPRARRVDGARLL
jgi:hypothetical protein